MNPVKKAYNFFKEYPGYLKTATSDVADKLGISEEAVTRGRRQYRKDNKDNKGTYDDYDKRENHENTNANEGYNKVDRPTALADQTLEEYCESIGLDPDLVDPYNDVKYWTDQRGNRRYSIVPKKMELADFNPVKEFQDSIKDYAPQDYSHLFDKPTNTNPCCGIISLFDAHLDKISSVRDTDEDRTIDDNIEDFEEAFDEVLHSIAAKKPEVILFPVGNDFFHTNDSFLATKKGTPMWDRVHETDMTAFRLGLNIVRKCIDKARSIAPVVIVPMRGNHDEDRIRYLLECLLIAYENQEDVDVMDTHKSRIYYRYYSLLFGFAHGDKQIKVADYPNLMTTDKDSKKHWSEISQGFFFLGHVHHEKRYEYMKSQDFRGCKVLFLRGVGGSDTWHWENGYTAISRTAYGFIFGREGDKEQEFRVNI